MSDYHNLDLRSPAARRAGGMSMRNVLATLAAIIFLFLLLAALGAGTRGGDPAMPTGAAEGTVPAVTQPAEE